MVATVIRIDVLTAALLRCPESQRMAGQRYAGEFDLPLYTADLDGFELVLRCRAR